MIMPRAAADIEANAGWWAANHSVEQAWRWFDTVYDQLKSLSNFPESHGLSFENDDFPYEIRDKLIGLGSHPSYRAVFTIRDVTVFVLTVRRASQDVLRPSQLEPPPAA
ncbi:MAG: type II toxin-antitoxin system RelE/ParE family toxin [Planctomycetaceae bacterium]